MNLPGNQAYYTLRASATEGRRKEVVIITVYTTDWCGYCAAAKSLLGRMGLEFTEINLTGDPERKATLKEKYGWRTVPMILVGERFIGGFRELSKLEKSGGLDTLLKGGEPEL